MTSRQLKIVFFASVREGLGSGELCLDAKGLDRVSDVIENLGRRGDNWQAVLTDEKLLIAVNQTVVPKDHPVTGGDEIAFFPPVTGG